MDLASLIEANKRGRSYRALADDCKGKPSHQRLQQLGSGARRRPSRSSSDDGKYRAIQHGLVCQSDPGPRDRGEVDHSTLQHEIAPHPAISRAGGEAVVGYGRIRWR